MPVPEIEATARHLTAISDEQLRVTTHVAYSIKRVGVFQFKLLLPADAALRVDRVAGPGNPQWSSGPPPELIAREVLGLASARAEFLVGAGHHSRLPPRSVLVQHIKSIVYI